MRRALKNLVVLLLALAVIGGAMPMPASAMGNHNMPGMAMPAGAMPCDQHKPAHNMPCDRQCCSCVLGSLALMDNPVPMVCATMGLLQPAWPPQSRPENRTQKPALPPPIA